MEVTERIREALDGTKKEIVGLEKRARREIDGLEARARKRLETLRGVVRRLRVRFDLTKRFASKAEIRKVGSRLEKLAKRVDKLAKERAAPSVARFAQR
jgi:hypothetical protein